MEELNYLALYSLQDRVIKAVFRVESGFYLTGGTCLHRFYHEKRYSDGLDFFDSDNMMFREDVRVVLDSISRDEPKDVFDIYTIYGAISLDWSEAMAAASKKCALDPEALKSRLLAFPPELVDFLHVTDRASIAEFQMGYRSMVDRLMAEF